MFRRVQVERPPVTDKAREAFLNLAGQDGEIDAYELQNILNNVFRDGFSFDGFSTDMTRSMVALRDYDMSGKLGYEDFKKMWSELSLCKKAFLVYDRDGSGHFNFAEFKRALETLGLHVPDAILRVIHLRYCGRDDEVPFDDFVACYLKLRTMLKSFQSKDPMETGEAVFDRDEFVQLVMYS